MYKNVSRVKGQILTESPVAHVSLLRTRTHDIQQQDWQYPGIAPKHFGVGTLVNKEYGCLGNTEKWPCWHFCT